MKRRALIASALLAALAPPALAAEAPMRREVLVLYNGAENVSLRDEGLPRAVEVVLNHYGAIARYHDLSQGLPPDEATRRARGIVSVLEGDRMPGAAAYARWLADRLEAGQKVAILGGLGFLADATTGAPVPDHAYAPVFAGLGLSYGGSAHYVPEQLAYGSIARGFEAPWPDQPPMLLPIKSRAPENQVLVRVKRKDGTQTGDMAVLSPRGAMVAGSSYLAAFNPVTYHMRWRLDPFKLLGEALDLEPGPHPDTTTLNGRRMFYAHIDGDGFANVANFPGRPLAAEVVRDRVLKKTPLPTTVSVIARDLVGKPEREAIARTIFALPHVEAASHSYHHPHDWKAGIGTPEGAVGDAGAAEHAEKEAFFPQVEIDGSIRYIRTLLPKGKPLPLMLWSGMTNPTAPFLARAEALGLANMNGGDASLDPRFPSYANLSPLARAVGPHLQVYTSAANENIFTRLWTGPFDGQLEALQLFEFQEKPRRMAPVNIYYHFYAGERPAGLRALEALYRYAEERPLAHVTASRYARVVEGFYRMTVTPDGPGAWRVEGGGECRTLRFDREPRTPDLKASSGVAGYKREGDRLYVHLAPGAARLVLAAAPASVPFLEEASAPLASWQASGQGVRATFEAAAPATVVIAGLPAGATVRLGGDFKGAKAADAAGRLRLTAPAGRVTLEVAR